MKKTVLTIAILALGTSLWAQENPALNASLENGFVRIGEFQSTTRNNVGAASFLFPSGDKLVTGLHSSISSEEFLSGLKPVNSLYSQINYNLVSYGWKDRIRGFHALEVGARVNYGVSVPKEIFQLLKEGTTQSPFDLSSLRAFGNVYGEIAYSYALPLSEKFSIGARAKLLVGLNSVELSARTLELSASEEQYTLNMDADVDLTNRYKKIGTDKDGYLDYTSFSGKGKWGLPTGLGLALDLGFVWKPFRGFTLSASVQDLGGILWYYGNAGRASGSYTFDGLHDLSADQLNAASLLSELKQEGEALLRVIKPHPPVKPLDELPGWVKAKALPLSANLDMRYAMPFWEALSVGATGLYSGYSYCAPYWEARGSLALDFPGRAQMELSAGDGAHGFVYGVSGSVEFVSFRLYARYENGIGGTIPYGNTPLQANNKSLQIGLVYLIK